MNIVSFQANGTSLNASPINVYDWEENKVTGAKENLMK